MDRPDDSGRSLDAMCHDIVGRHHASVFRSLPRVRDELARLSSTPALAELRLAFASFADQIRGHLAKEEHLLFPSFVALASAEREGTRPALPFSTVLHPIRMMEAEHVRIEAALDRLRAAALAVPSPTACHPDGTAWWRSCRSWTRTCASNTAPRTRSCFHERSSSSDSFCSSRGYHWPRVRPG